MAAGITFHWDGVDSVSQSVELQTGSEPNPLDLPVARPFTPDSWQAQCQSTTERHTGPSLSADKMDRSPSSPPQAIDWQEEARSLTFYLDSGLLPAAARGVSSGITGKLVWVWRGEQAQPITLYVHPVLLVHATVASPQMDRVEMVPHLHTGDPLLHHIMLVLQAEINAEDMAGRVYAESLINALAVHFLRRCAVCLPPVRTLPKGLAPYKLRRTTTYIQQHLEHELSLVDLAAVAQTSPAHFARLFKHATGKTPHQYVLSCRIDRAKQLLMETLVPLSEVGYQVGCTDQSHFTALFRKHVGMTPKAYRDATHRE
jgi:AraC-like DNA-binding protein